MALYEPGTDRASIAEIRLEILERGTGVLDRWLAQRTNGANRLVALDVNPYLLQEAEAMSRREGWERVIEFNQGSAEQLPYPEHHFDVTWSSTVIQRVDADRMLAEMVRVTRPGGRVGVRRGDDEEVRRAARARGDADQGPTV